MLQAIVTVLFSIVIVFAASVQSTAGQPTDNGLERLKTKIYRFGLGGEARVVLRKKNGSRITGFISSTDDMSFEVTNSKTGQKSVVTYTDVAAIRKPRRGIVARVAIAAGTATAVTAVMLAIRVRAAFQSAF